VVYVHTGKLADEEAHRFTLAAPGHRYAIIPENSRPTPLERECAHRALSQSFPGDRGEWISALLDAAVPWSVNRGQIVVRQNDLTRDFFVVLSGKLAVLVAGEEGRPQKIAEIHPGEIFGEMAVIMDSPRTATVEALTPVRLLRVPGDSFRRFALRENLAGQLRNLWARRSEIQSVDILAPLPVTLVNELARLAAPQTISPSSTLIREGAQSSTVYILVHGRLQVFKGEQPLSVNGAPVVLHPGQLVGETAPFREAARNASVVALDECQVLAIDGADFRRVVRQAPQLHFQISMMVRSRQAAA
jgi:CRP-like cAMP-binding protein